MPLAVGVLGAAFFLGTRQRANDFAPQMGAGATPAGDAVGTLIRFHEFSSDSRGSVFTRAPGIEWGGAPPQFKSYPEARHVSLERGAVGAAGFSAALGTVSPRTGPLQMTELGDILYLGAGVTARRGGNALRAAPSSGALFSNELYVLARAVDGLAPGAYHYDPDQHRLDLVGVLPGVTGAPTTDDADAVVIATSVFRRTGYKYRDRAYRYVTADTGQLGERWLLGAVARGLAACPVGAFYDDEAAALIGVDRERQWVLHFAALGVPSRRADL